MDWINNGTIKNLKVSGDIAKIKKEDQLPISKEDKKIHEIDIFANRSHSTYIYSLLVDGTKNLDF